MPGTYHGVIRGNTIELDQSPGFAEGEAVQVTITPSTNGASPSSPEALEALKRAAGAWHDDIAGLDRYLEWNRSQRKSNRRGSGMSFLLDTDICSAYPKNDPAAVRHVMLHFGGLSVSAITVGELFVWARRRNAPAAREVGVRGFLGSCRILGIHWPELDEDLSIAGLMAGVDWQSA